MQARGEWKFIGKEYFDLANTIQQDAYQVLNTRAGVSTKLFDLFFWAKNFTGTKYIAYAYDFGAVHLGDPSTFGCTLSYRF